MLQQECVLVVDEISDTAEVLQAVLEPRGVAVNRVRRLDEHKSDGIDRPSVVVVDADSQADCAPPFGRDWQNVPQVIIGTVRTSADASTPGSERRFLHKPFQFAELVQAIESLIGPR